MGCIARWVDARTDKQRDCIIVAQDWCIGITRSVFGGRCLIGHTGHSVLNHKAHAAAVRFDDLAVRVGLDRAVQLVKARATKGNRVEVPAAAVPEPATV